MDAKLYHLEGCPYCRRLRDFIAHRGLGRHVEYQEVSQDPDALQRLRQLTGRMQVPVLEVDGDAIIGSDVIIDWLDENAAGLTRAAAPRGRAHPADRARPRPAS